MADHGNQHHADDSHAHDNSGGELKSKTAFRSSFWFVIILVGLFIAALNFIEVMGHGEEGHKNHEATATGTLKGETGLGRASEDTTQAHPAGDTHGPMEQQEGHH